ncbi:MAG: carboxymuconolactone decarboxylase family protein [Acidobacteriota bacterium]|nr:carboxymuconolactone decarboxylase family protein [Acidobacteriota bacterium]
MDRRMIGAHKLHAIDGERGEAVVRAVRQVSPTLADAITEFAFGQIFCKAELGRRERELATVAILGAIGGAETQLRVHLAAALRSGIDPDELIALCEHLAPYAGRPGPSTCCARPAPSWRNLTSPGRDRHAGLTWAITKPLSRKAARANPTF